MAVLELDPLFLTAVRAAIAALLALCAADHPAGAPTRADLPPLLFVALGVVIGFPLLTALALQHTTSAHSLVYIGLLPLATAGFGVLRGGERPKPAFGLFRRRRRAGGRFRVEPGSGGAWQGCADGRGGVAVRPGLCRRGGAVAPDRRLAGDLLGAGGGVAVDAGATWLAAPAGWPAISGAAWLSLVYVSVFSMWIGFIFWYRGLAQGGIAAVGQLQLLQPFFGLALAGWLLHETVQPMMIAVMAGVVVCVFGAKRFPARRRCAGQDHLSEPFHRLLHLAVGVTAQSSTRPGSPWPGAYIGDTARSANPASLAHWATRTSSRPFLSHSTMCMP